MPTNLQRAPREDFTMQRGEFASPTTAKGASNFGTGVQPARSVATRAPQPDRNLGTMTSADLNRSVNDRGMPLGGAIGQKPSLTGGPVTSGYSEYTPPAAAPLSTVATRAPYNPPQQTERANPLTGDNNIPMESTTTTVARAPFVQRGSALPTGQDAMPAAVKTTLTEDNDIGTAMAGTQNRIGGSGAFTRKFNSPTSASAYDSYVKRLFPATSS